MDANIAELERLGVDYQNEFPFCLNATWAAAAIMALDETKSPSDAAPHVNRAIEAITGMNDDIELARAGGGRNLPPDESLVLCAQAVVEVMEGVGR